MSIIDRPMPRRGASLRRLHVEASAPEYGSGGYVSTAVRKPHIEGSYVSTGTDTAPGTRGTYVTTSAPAARPGGRYTYTG